MVIIILSVLKKRKSDLGYFLAIAAAILGGLADVLPKPILDYNSDALDPVLMTGFMFIINGIFFSAVIQLYNKSLGLPCMFSHL